MVDKLQSWQEKLWADIETGGVEPGEMMIMTAGRNIGKSMFSSQAAINRLMRDILSHPIEELKLTESRIHGAVYHLVEPIGGNWREMELWCTETFGPISDIWNEKVGRWYANDRKFWFRKERDRTMFVLRWSSR
jgi:hypothetical protein